MSAMAAVAAAQASGPGACGDGAGLGRVLRVGVARASLALVAALVLWSVLPVVVGWTPRVILSGSMEPRIHVGDVVATRPVSPATLVKGQVITVKDPDHPGRTRTHRLLRREAGGKLVLKGDANPQADSTPVSVDAVLGLGSVRVPYVGRPAYWMAEGNWLGLGATALYLGWCVVTVLPSSGRRDDQEKRRPGDGSPRNPRPRRVAAALAAAAVAVGGASGPADAAFKVTAANPTLVPDGLHELQGLQHRGAGRLALPVLAARRDQRHHDRRRERRWAHRDHGRHGHAQPDRRAHLGDPEPGDRVLDRLDQHHRHCRRRPGELQRRGLDQDERRPPAGASSASATPPARPARPRSTASSTWARTARPYFGVGSARTTVASLASVSDNAWHHVVGTYTSGTNGMKLYVDGALQGSATATVQSFTGYWKAGREHLTSWTNNPTDDYFDGTLDELAVYNTVLTPEQVTSHFTNATN